MRFIHTADWQIGMQAAHVGAAGARVREARLEAGKNVVAQANAADAEFMVVAGDTFENNAVDRVLVQQVVDILASFRGPVFLLSGNHDPLTPGSVWDHPGWTAHSNLHVLRDAQPIAINGGTLYPCPIVEKHSQRDPTLWIDAKHDQPIAVGIAHGTVLGAAMEDLDYPIPRNAAERAGLDYLAIGHWHSFATFPGGDGAARLVYSGTHETTKFGERNSGNALLVEIASRGAAPKLTSIRTGAMTWSVWERELQSAADIAQLVREVESLSDSKCTLLDIRLRGVLHPQSQGDLDRLSELLRARCCYGRIDDSALLPPPADDWLDDLPNGLLRDVGRELQSLATGADAVTTPAVAQQALLELYRALHGRSV